MVWVSVMVWGGFILFCHRTRLHVLEGKKNATQYRSDGVVAVSSHNGLVGTGFASPTPSGFLRAQ